MGELALEKVHDENETEKLTYDPAHFIRCHGTGKNNQGPADTNTQIWDVSFEPDPRNPENNTTRLATCGGNSICVLDIISGEVLMKYSHKDKAEDFYTIAWSLIPSDDGSKKSVLVSGSVKGEICLFYPDEKVCFYIWPFTRSLMKDEKKRRRIELASNAINSVVFHSEKYTWLFVGLGNGVVYLYDIGSNFILPEYTSVSPQQLLKLEPQLGEIYNIIWTGNDSKWLMAGAKGGMVGWKIEETKILEKKETNKPLPIYFKMPKSTRKGVDETMYIVDSLTTINEWTIACKCVMHGCIYIIDLEKSTDGLEVSVNAKPTKIEKESVVVGRLDWSKTDNYYMNIGCNRQGLICCGDDEGSLWVYDQPRFVKRLSQDAIGQSQELPLIKANVRLMWPDLQDEHLENAEVPEKERYDIIVDKVTISEDGQHIIAVTSNNMICIWKRQ